MFFDILWSATFDIDYISASFFFLILFAFLLLFFISFHIMSGSGNSFAVAIVIASLAGPQWLWTEEKLPNTNYNGTMNYYGRDDGVYVTKYTKSSLWILCFTLGNQINQEKKGKKLIVITFLSIKLDFWSVCRMQCDSLERKSCCDCKIDLFHLLHRWRKSKMSPNHWISTM